MSSSPARIQSLRHQAVQNQAMDNATSTNGIGSNPMFHQMQMNFDYNQNPNPNGLELAGFCSPSGKVVKKYHEIVRNKAKIILILHLGPASVASMSQCSSIHLSDSPQHQQSPLHQSHYQQLNANQHMKAGSSKSFYQYLTPPSHNDSGNHTPPQHLVQTLDSYPTPSPESPGHWSSSQSPHSISDWSESQSPANQNHYVTTNTHQGPNKGSEAIYI